MNISKLRHEIGVAKTFIRNDRQTIIELEAVLADLGDVRAEAANWRLEQSRKGLPIPVLPLKLTGSAFKAESVQDTINAATDAIVPQQETHRTSARDAPTFLVRTISASWDRVCDEARAVCDDLEVARVAYLAASKKLYALHQETLRFASVS